MENKYETTWDNFKREIRNPSFWNITSEKKDSRLALIYHWLYVKFSRIIECKTSDLIFLKEEIRTFKMADVTISEKSIENTNERNI